MLEVRQLAVLRAVAESGSLSGAARHMGYTQPAISQHIQRLERLLGTPLIVRARSGSVLTEAGRVLVRHSETVLDTIARAEAEVSAIAGLRSGRVRIAAFPSAAATIVAAAMACITMRFPGVTFTLTEAQPARALEMLEKGECDISVVFHYSTWNGSEHGDLTWLPLMEEDLYVVLPEGHALLAKDEVVLKDLRGERWIAGCPDCRWYIEDACRHSGFNPDIAFETDDYVTLQQLALRGLGVAVLPHLVLAAVRFPELQVRPLRLGDQRVVSAVSSAGLMKVPGIQETVEVLRRESMGRGHGSLA